MKIVLCGGGSGGHITPLLAVARELKALDPKHVVVYVGEKRGKFSYVAEKSGLFDELHYVSAGKLRRYHGESLLKRLLDVKTNALNVRDSFYIAAGIVQAWLLFKKLQADAVLLKGGYVCVPAALGAKAAHIPMITHDSDALPGLSNRFAAKYAMVHATGMPVQYYKYPKDSAQYVGVPVDSRFREFSASEKRFLKEKFNIAPDAQVVLITGGSNGAQRLNSWVVAVVPRIVAAYPNVHIVHLIGKGNEKQYKALPRTLRKHVSVVGFSDELYNYSAIADVIVTRAGATTMAEFAAQSKACIVVPNPDLTGGHQLKNANVYAAESMAYIVHEKELKISTEPLFVAIDSLLKDAALRTSLGAKLHHAMPEVPAAQKLAQLLVEVARK